MSGQESESIDPSVKKVTVGDNTNAVERFDPNVVEESDARTAAKKAMAHPSRGIMLTRLKFPSATGR